MSEWLDYRTREHTYKERHYEILSEQNQNTLISY